MNEIVSVGGYLAMGVALLLLVIAGLFWERPTRLQTDDAAPMLPPEPPRPRTPPSKAANTPAGTTVDDDREAEPAVAPAASPAPVAEVAPIVAGTSAVIPVTTSERSEPSSPPDVVAASAAVASPRNDSSTEPGAASRARWTDLGWLVLGTFLAVIAVLMAGRLWIAPADLEPFWWLIAVGTGFAAIALLGLGWPDADRDAPGAAPSAADSGEIPSTGRRPIRLTLTVVAAALLIEVASLALFQANRLLTIAWLLHGLAAGLLVYGLWRVSGRSDRRLVVNWNQTDTIWVTALTVAGLLPRVWDIASIPEGIWFDESQRGLEVFRILAERGYRPIFATGILQEPTGLWYLMAPLVAMLGNDPFALRLPVAIGGALGVAAVYLLARVLYGRRVAVAAAGLLVGLAWHVNFSRIALPAVLSLTCDTLAAAFFVAGLRRGSRFWLGAAGVVGGAGLYFYYTSQLMPAVLAVAVGQQLLAGRVQFVKRNAAGLALFVVGFLLATGPFTFFAVTNWTSFSARAGTVSVFREVERAESWEPLVNNVRAHLLMFHVRGDPNGRHNWSSRPMLDAVTGGLAMMGLALALTRFWRVEQVLVLVWLPAALAGGIFSLSFEAPQSHRAIGAIIPAVLLAALPLGLLWQRVDQLVGAGLRARAAPGVLAAFNRARASNTARLAPAALVVVLLFGVGVANLDRFFNKQIRDPRTWMELTSPQTDAGRHIAPLPADMKVYLEPSWAGHPSIRFVDSVRREYVPFDPGTQIPVTDASAAIFIGERPNVAERIAALYPSAIRTYTRVPETGNVVGYGFILTSDVLQATRGVLARYQGPDGTIERREPALDQDWSQGTPVPAPFEASWTTTLSVPAYNAYRLKLEGPPSLVLTLDGAEILRGGGEGSIKLARGNHALRLAGTELGAEPVRLLWAVQNDPLRPLPGSLLNTAPVQATGLMGRVYRGEEPSGEALVEQVDPNVELTVHLLPAARPYTIEWTGALRVERAGRYQMGVSSLGTSAIWVDGTQVAANTTPNGSNDGEIELTQGWHNIRVRFVDNLGFSHVTAFWQPPGRGRETIPTSVLRPWPAHRVVAARPEDGDLPAPTDALADDNAPQVVKIVPPETANGRIVLGEGRAVGPSGALRQPRGIAVAPDGTIYVADAARQTIVALAPDGSSRALGEGNLKEPSAVAVADDGLIVADAGAGSIIRMDLNGQVGERLFQEYPLYSPRGLTVAPGGEIVVSDTGNNRLLVRRPDGTVQVVNDLTQPTGGVMLGDGTFLVAETGSSRVVQVQADGKRLTTWTMPPSTTVVGPHVGLLPDGGWVVSLPDEAAVMARPAGAAGATIWQVGPAAKKPSGLAIGPAGLVVGDVDANMVRAFEIP